ncbi:hypothetical protein KL86CLO1_10524 [uncultured Eubacteriales bacterium]|uniref:Uncharacterized protein n=1 Tax=uncultured Eubacteriales bacterium TaxID=172733 RepID=A0A212J4Z8_9FIRM|nr:hypothetical protein KL86CLO1_10524 [uncultured Eubacteriales bacterium]
MILAPRYTWALLDVQDKVGITAQRFSRILLTKMICYGNL